MIGPLADDGYEQLGTWVFDGESHHSHTCLQALHDLVGNDLGGALGPGHVQSSRCRDREGFEDRGRGLRSESDVA